MPGRPPYPGTPRWVKASGKAALVLAGLAVLVMIVSGGQHGPWRHFSATGGTDAASPPPATDGN